MKKVIFTITIITVFVISIWAQSAIVVTPNELMRAYQQNSLRADEQFKGKILQVTGRITAFDRSLDGRPVVILNNGINVNFIRSEENKVLNLSRGQTVTIRGTCGGLLFFVMINNSVIVP